MKSSSAMMPPDLVHLSTHHSKKYSRDSSNMPMRQTVPLLCYQRYLSPFSGDRHAWNDDDGAAAAVGIVAERADTFVDGAAAGTFEEEYTLGGRERLRRSKTALHHRGVLLLLVEEEDSRWHSTGSGIEVGWCDSLEVGLKEAYNLEHTCQHGALR